MSQELFINHDQALALFDKYKGFDAVQKGNKLVIFFPEIPVENLVNISNLKMVSKYTKQQIKGYGAVFFNPEDKCNQPIILRNEDGTPNKGCLIIRLPEDVDEAREAALKIQKEIEEKIKLDSADDIAEAAMIAARVKGDVYCSNIDWFNRSTQKYDENAPEPDFEGFNLVKAKGNKVKVLLASGSSEEDSILFDSGIVANSQKFTDGKMYLIKDGDHCRGCSSNAFPELYGIMSDKGLEAIDLDLIPKVDLTQESFEVEVMGAGPAADA